MACLGGLGGTVDTLCPFQLGWKYAQTPLKLALPHSVPPLCTGPTAATRKATREATTAALNAERPSPVGGSGGGRLESSRPTPQWLRSVERKGIPCCPSTVSSSSLHTVRVRLADCNVGVRLRSISPRLKL